MKADADAAGMDAGRLARIDEHLMSRYIAPGKIAGAQVAVVRHGALAHYSALGLADRERNRPVAEDTIWRIYSMTKPITAVALMTLYEQGYFQLNDPVERFIPQWRDIKVGVRDESGEKQLVRPARPMQVRDLLMHMSGIGYGPGNGALDLGPVGEERRAPAIRLDHDLEAMIDRLATTPLRFHPGTHWLYSLGIDVCGRLVEIMSGQRLDQYMRDAIFGPLGMNDTGFCVPAADADRLAGCYARNTRKELVLVDDPATSSYLTPPSFLAGGGGLVSTIGDYLRFTGMLSGGGELDGRRILSRKTVELMAANHLPGGGQLSDFALPGGYGEVGFEGMGFGLSMAVNAGPAASAGSGSTGDFMWGGAASTTFWVDPVEDMSVVFMTQLLPSGTFNFRGQLRSIVYGAIAD
jgi:CubicO group peptidase (beta-lactamase class C family)